MARGEYFPFKTLPELEARVATLGLADVLGFDPPAGGNGHGVGWTVLSTKVQAGPFLLRNRFVCHPMEGWDGHPETGAPTEDVYRRWERMGESGCALVWGVEAFAVDFPWRANRNQVVMRRENLGLIADGLARMRAAHVRAFGKGSKLVIGAQLTCSGRYSFGRPEGTPLALVYHHPELDARLTAGPDTPLLTDGELEGIVGLYEPAAAVAREAGFDFIDLKACHRYWINETLAAKTRPGPYGGSFANRTKIIRMALAAIRRACGAEFPVGCRLSAYDGLPHAEDPATKRPGLKGLGRPSPFTTPYVWGFGVDEADPTKADLAEPLSLVGLLKAEGVRMFNISAASPYSNPHLSRPTESPPVDGYQPAHDPLIEVAQHFGYARAFKEAHPDVFVVGTGYSYLRQFKAAAAAFNLRQGRVDAVGLGRALLAYPDEASRLLKTGEAKKERGRVVCTGDSACTTGPRLGLRSGCIFDPHYVETMQEITKRLAALGLTKK